MNPRAMLERGELPALRAAAPSSFADALRPGGGFVVVAGPCSVESREQLLLAAGAVAAAGAHALRAGAWKPRTSPHGFEGLREEGLRLLAEARAATGLPIVTEVVDPRDVELLAERADVLQVGARNMQNFALLDELGRQRERPVLLKRGLSATVAEWLLAAERLVARGARSVALCERGVRSFDPEATRNVLDLAGAVLARRVSGLPVLADPSHASGDRSLVLPLSLAAMAAGLDGLLVEVHPEPARALTDAPQQLSPGAFAELAEHLRKLGDVLGRAPRDTIRIAPSVPEVGQAKPSRRTV